jgi:sugar phosphate isomerase/epimerase
MRIGFASLVGIERLPLPELLRDAREIGVDAVELNVGPAFPRIAGAPYEGHIDVAAAARDGAPVRELAAGHGVRIAALAPMLNLLTPDQALRERRVTYTRTAIDACAALEVPVLVTYGGSPYGMHFWGLPSVGDGHPSNKVAESVAIFRDVFAPLVRHAEERGVKIALETAPRGGGEGNIAHAPELWDLLFEAVPSPALGLSFDPSHLVWLGIRDVPGLIHQYATRIHHVDAKDAEVLPDRLARQGVLGNAWWRYRIPGKGELDWASIVAALHETGYDEVLTIENEDPFHPGLEGVRLAAAHLRALLEPVRTRS